MSIPKKILLIEDNKEISNNIKEFLELEGLIITQCFNGVEGLDNALHKKYDLILLDLMLPKLDGLSVAKKLSNKIDTKIIMITAKDSIEQKLEGFDSGAIDYIVKPFDLRELEARVKAILSLNSSFKIIEYKNKDIFIKINLDKREFIKNEIKLNITTKEFLIFEYLFEHKNRVCTRSDLIEYVWGTDSLFDDDSKLDVYISNLRKKLDKSIIETIKGVGYSLSLG